MSLLFQVHRYQIAPAGHQDGRLLLLSRWKAEFLENAPKVFEPDERRSEDRARIRELERLLGQQALDLEIAKKASNILTAHQNRSRKSS